MNFVGIDNGTTATFAIYRLREKDISIYKMPLRKDRVGKYRLVDTEKVLKIIDDKAWISSCYFFIERFYTNPKFPLAVVSGALNFGYMLHALRAYDPAIVSSSFWKKYLKEKNYSGDKVGAIKYVKDYYNIECKDADGALLALAGAEKIEELERGE